MKKGNLSDCANCGLTPQEKVCMNPKGKGAKGCPILIERKLASRVKKEYQMAKVREFARQASIQEGECYAGREKKPYVMHTTKPRIQEMGEFARKMGYNRLGLVFCVGLSKEAMVVNQILKSQGFETVSVACKVGSFPKEEIGVKDSEKIYIGEYESMCNPNSARTLCGARLPLLQVCRSADNRLGGQGQTDRSQPFRPYLPIEQLLFLA